ncbi:MAG: bifunctional folylpolyglutamate synthase/dihydrofolate synthase [Massilibacteroides sp.]|nr:bifunctional folylpolyglutamate synthase/dihydrofolate synthase [Massilibacteroides sp.]MDD3062448.1 bifunctional folylpolyglutamate synthase/dihydrofolate synthase [Massilibacteroides sp.]MDD4114821.1 bifunctional folylpolyglutamate synthase/dihydrofolate synthase [Massilibacteroides sp.]MDD4659851.1 bifunctional folylpolyglutamate synthase/dihydrofolate synthase [Massilibacteroides sp.]
MTYEETLYYLYHSIPMYQRCGATAYKPGLGTSVALDNYMRNPHRSYKTIHVAGTNGKGSTCHLLAAILQSAGYKTGLYTSPHLVDFRERIRVNGKMISEKYVVDFVEKHRPFYESLSPSFFELTSTLAFSYFQEERVDFAVIEVGLGGRLDSTNIITPELSVITNISLDHTQFLGNTLEAIASEKAGIIKPGIPVLIGETGSTGVRNVFWDKAKAENAPIFFAEENDPIQKASMQENGRWVFETKEFGQIDGELGGMVQLHNARTVFTALRLLIAQGVRIDRQAILDAFAHVTVLTGLMGRWQLLQTSPRVICDTGHNPGGWQYLSDQLQKEKKHADALHLVVGMVNDKDVHTVLSLMPKNATYYFTQPSVERAMPVEHFAAQAVEAGLKGRSFTSVSEAVSAALSQALPNDFVFIGGSSFVVADALPLFLHK